MDENWPEGLGERLAQARKDAGFSQPKVAKLLDRTTGSISNWEREERTPDLEEIRRFAEVTDADLRWLLHGHGYQDPLRYLAARIARLETMLSTVPGASAPPELPAELARFDVADPPNGRRAPSKSRRPAAGSR